MLELSGTNDIEDEDVFCILKNNFEYKSKEKEDDGYKMARDIISMTSIHFDVIQGYRTRRIASSGSSPADESRCDISFSSNGQRRYNLKHTYGEQMRKKQN
ncbi:hypothetical protein KPH14_006611 [Odynerus spinipes]|uniref:Uncharacterized protein n=1 Tax=Odynerus spinipes TaxID=1348599 RepID=A0AAD9RRT2_9HYME|nr:hypothetical protein KPH14_006611 [Odynerus spinipes]